VIEADPVRQHVDPSLEIGRAHSGDPVIRRASLTIGSVAPSFFLAKKSPSGPPLTLPSGAGPVGKRLLVADECQDLIGAAFVAHAKRHRS
jgi:hypothetical protein